MAALALGNPPHEEKHYQSRKILAAENPQADFWSPPTSSGSGSSSGSAGTGSGGHLPNVQTGYPDPPCSNPPWPQSRTPKRLPQRHPLLTTSAPSHHKRAWPFQWCDNPLSCL